MIRKEKQMEIMKPQQVKPKHTHPSSRPRSKKLTYHANTVDIRQFLTNTHKRELNSKIPGTTEGEAKPGLVNSIKSKTYKLCDQLNPGEGDKLTKGSRPKMTTDTVPK